VGIVVGLTPVDERLLTLLLSVAVAETKPDEVMPPVEAPPGWSQPRRDAFCEFYRSHYRGLNGPTRTLTYGILCNSDVVGMIRMWLVATVRTLWRPACGSGGQREAGGSA
jgi:hypothetical protein